MLIKRGDIFYADLNPVIGSEEGGIRPVLIVQNEAGNHHSPTIIIIPISSICKKNHLPVHIQIENVLPKKSIAMAEQIRTIDRSRMLKYAGSVDCNIMEEIDAILKISLGVGS